MTRLCSDRLSITIDLNAELFLAGLDASLVRDTDDAPQGKDYDALRALAADQLAQKFTNQWPDFEKALDGLADDRPLSFQLDAIEVEDNPAVTLPRSSKIQISAPLEPSDANVRFGWNAALGPLVIRQQSQTEKLENLYTAYLEPGADQRSNQKTRRHRPAGFNDHAGLCQNWVCSYCAKGS